MNVFDFHVEGQGLACQRVVEINGDLLVIKLFDHTRKLGVGRVVEDHQQALRQLHVLELRTRNDLHILRVWLAKGVFRKNLQCALVTRLETEQRRFKPWQQAAITDLEGGRGLVEGAVDGVAVFQTQSKMQRDLRVLTNTLLSHERFPRTFYF